MADNTNKTWAEDVQNELENLVWEVGSAGQNLGTCQEWGTGVKTAEKELADTKQRLLDFISQNFTIKEQ